MKKIEEKKTVVTSVRLSQEQKNKIQKLADQKEMSFNGYLIAAASNGDTALDPKKLVHIQNIMNLSYELAKQYEPKKISMIQKEEKAIWTL